MKIINKVIIGVISLIVLFQILAGTAADVGTAADELTVNGSATYPLTGLFGKGGVVLLLVMVGVLFAVLKYFMPSK